MNYPGTEPASGEAYFGFFDSRHSYNPCQGEGEGLEHKTGCDETGHRNEDLGRVLVRGRSFWVSKNIPLLKYA